MELALERTADVAVDKEAVKKDEFSRRGKSAAGKYLSNPSKSKLDEQLGDLKGDEYQWVKDGIVDTMLANLTLPRVETDLSTLPVIADGLKSLMPRKSKDTENFDYLMNQYAELFKQYLGNIGELEQQLRAQWEPRLRQKEQQLKQQTGRESTLTPEQDPEFGKVLSEELSRLDKQYGEVLSQGKAEIRKLI